MIASVQSFNINNHLEKEYRMKKLLLVTVFGLCLITAAHAADQKVTWITSTGVQSEYLAKIGVILSDSPVSISFVEANYKDFYGGLWNATTLGGDEYGTTYGDEWDIYGGWAHTFGPVKLNLSAAYFAMTELDETSDDMWVTDQELSLPKMPFVQPYIASRYFGSVGSSWREGWFVFGGLRKSITLGQWTAKRPVALNLEASTAYSAGALRDFTGFVYGRFTTSLDIPLSKSVTLSPNLVYQIPASGQRNNPNGFTDRNKFVFGGKITWIF